MSDKQLLSKIYKVSLKLNNKSHQPDFKIGQKLWYLTKEGIQMTNKHVKRYSTSYVIREIQIKAKRYHFIPIKMAKIQNHWQHLKLKRTENSRNSHALPEGMQNSATTLEYSLVVSYRKPNILLPCDLAITLLGIYPKELKTCPHNILHTGVHSSLIIAKTLKQSRCPSKVNGQINYGAYNGILFSAVKN